MSKLVITSRPISTNSPAYLLLENVDQSLEKLYLNHADSVHISFKDRENKYCTGWYDVSTHTNYVCTESRKVDNKYDSCFECRQKTGFNPAFYNISDISVVQRDYNDKPHSVYVSYFGDGLAKAGIMSNSRGLERLLEQGAILYHIVGSFENADAAHEIESRLINSGLKNSVTKKQKEKILSKSFSEVNEKEIFASILNGLDLTDGEIVSNLGHFFFGKYPSRSISPISNNPISGFIHGVVGRYLVLDNNGRLYGFWLSNLNGFNVEIDGEVKNIDSEPEQISLFG